MQRYHLRNPGIVLPSLVPDDSGSWVSWKDVTDKILQLQAIVDKIPIMADGEPALIGETAFVRWSVDAIEECTIISLDNKEIKGRFKRGIRFVCLSRVYETRQAAEQIDTISKEAHQELTEAILDVMKKWYSGEHTWLKHQESLKSAVEKYGSKQ